MSAHEGMGRISPGEAYVSIDKYSKEEISKDPLLTSKIEEITRAGREKLQSALAAHTIQGNIFADEKIAQFSRELNMPSAWTREETMRLALMYIEGYAPFKIADQLDSLRSSKAATLSDNLISRYASAFLTDEVITRAAQNRLNRKWRELTRPESAVLEKDLKDLEAKAGLEREKILVFPSDRQTRTRGKYDIGQFRKQRSAYDPDVLIPVLHARFVENLDSNAQYERLQAHLGRSVKRGTLKTLFSLSLTEEAKRVLMPRDEKQVSSEKKEKFWTIEKYNLIATRLVTNRNTRYADLVSLMGKQAKVIAARVQLEGKRLVTEKEEYGDQLPLAAFILEYADLSAFPDASQKAEVALTVARDNQDRGRHTRLKRLPRVEVYTKKSWGTEDYKKIAQLILEDNLISTDEIGGALQRPRDSIAIKIRREGEKLAKQEKYKGIPAFVAFVLEYGVFAPGVDARAIAEQADKAYRDSSAKKARRLTKQKEAA